MNLYDLAARYNARQAALYELRLLSEAEGRRQDVLSQLRELNG